MTTQTLASVSKLNSDTQIYLNDLAQEYKELRRKEKNEMALMVRREIYSALDVLRIAGIIDKEDRHNIRLCLFSDDE